MTAALARTPVPSFSARPEKLRNFGREDMNIMLAHEIQSLWRALGYTRVRVWSEGGHGPNGVCCVRSNLVNGLPPRGNASVNKIVFTAVSGFAGTNHERIIDP